MKAIAMIRDADAFPDSHHATVDEVDVAAWQEAGWQVADPLDHDRDGKPGGSAAGEADAIRERIIKLGGSFHHKAGVEKLTDALNELLDATHDDAGGLSHRELNADLEAAGVEFDPYASPADKFALLNAATQGEG
jgi:hypothetical protein